MVDFNRQEVVLIDRENKTALTIDTAVLLTHTLPNIEPRKITKREKWPWKSKISGSLTINLYAP